MTLSYSLNQKINQAFIVYNSLASPNLKKRIRESGLTLAGLVTLLCLAAWHSWWSGLGTLFVLALIVYLFTPYAYRLDIDNLAKKTLEEKPQEELAEPVELSLTEWGLVESRPSSSLSLRYDQIKRIVFNEEAVYIFYRGLEAVIVPLSAFSGQEQRDSFLKLICQGNPGLERPCIPAFTEVSGPPSLLAYVPIVVICGVGFMAGGTPYSEPLRTCPDSGRQEASADGFYAGFEAPVSKPPLADGQKLPAGQSMENSVEPTDIF